MFSLNTKYVFLWRIKKDYSMLTAIPDCRQKGNQSNARKLLSIQCPPGGWL